MAFSTGTQRAGPSSTACRSLTYPRHFRLERSPDQRPYQPNAGLFDRESALDAVAGTFYHSDEEQLNGFGESYSRAD